uniref:Uncharacterized protein n=1 Tax=Ananas comosus var. bracteatus TaxID=296719 RepID=A0A6V7Q430_ANACO|nr:unnamed protein product [Ananas comosus var. bracteatus]
MVLGIVEIPASRMHYILCSRGTFTLVDRVSSCEDWIILTNLFCLSVVAPPRHESPEYFTRGKRSCPADGLDVRVQLLLTYEIESDLDLVGKSAESAAEPTGNYIYIVLTPCGFGVQVHTGARIAARALCPKCVFSLGRTGEVLSVRRLFDAPEPDQIGSGLEA